jgi:hypothetical protein
MGIDEAPVTDRDTRTTLRYRGDEPPTLERVAELVAHLRHAAKAQSNELVALRRRVDGHDKAIGDAREFARQANQTSTETSEAFRDAAVAQGHAMNELAAQLRQIAAKQGEDRVRQADEVGRLTREFAGFAKSQSAIAAETTQQTGTLETIADKVDRIQKHPAGASLLRTSATWIGVTVGTVIATILAARAVAPTPPVVSAPTEIHTEALDAGLGGAR